MKKKWTPAARAAFARKMKAARLAKRGGRKKNPKRRRIRRKNARRRVRASMRFVVYQKSRNRKTTVRRFEDLAPAKTFARGYAKEHPYVAVMVQRI